MLPLLYISRPDIFLRVNYKFIRNKIIFVYDSGVRPNVHKTDTVLPSLSPPPPPQMD